MKIDNGIIYLIISLLILLSFCKKSDNGDNSFNEHFLKRDTIIENELFKESKNDTFRMHKDSVKCHSGYTKREMVTLFITNNNPIQKAVINKFGLPDTSYLDTTFEPCSSLVYICGKGFVSFHYKINSDESIGHSEGIIINGKFIKRTSGMLFKGKG